MTGKNRTQSLARARARARIVSSFQNLEAEGLYREVWLLGGNVGSLYDLTVECSVRRICHGHTFISHLPPPPNPPSRYLFLSQSHQRAGEPSWVEGTGR